MIFKMNCARVRKMLPLYTGGDLRHDARRERAVTKHLRACDGCAQRAAEFNASRNLLSASTLVPPFDAAFYDNIRGEVRARIEVYNAAPQPLLVGIFRRRLAYAMVAALLAISTALVAYTRLGQRASDLTTLNRSIAEDGARDQDAARGTGASSVRSRDTSELSSHDVSIIADANETRSEARADRYNVARIRVLRRVSASPQRALSAPPSARFAPALLTQDERRTEIHEAANETPYEEIAQTTLTGDIDEGDDQMLRIEFQTSDPTIRIIWFAPQTSTSPTETQTNDNGS